VEVGGSDRGGGGIKGGGRDRGLGGGGRWLLQMGLGVCMLLKCSACHVGKTSFAKICQYKAWVWGEGHEGTGHCA